MSEDKNARNDRQKATKKLRLQELYRKGIESLEQGEELSKQAQLRRLKALRDKISKELSPRQIEFCNEYFKDFNVAKAAMRAGYAESTANQGNGVSSQPGIKEYIDVNTKINSLNTNVTAEFVINEFNKLAKVRVTDLYDENGLLIPPHKLPEDIAAAVSKVTQKTIELPNGTKVIEFSYQLHPKVAALDALGKHTGIYLKDNQQKAPTSLEPAVVVYIPENGREAVITLPNKS